MSAPETRDYQFMRLAEIPTGVAEDGTPLALVLTMCVTCKAILPDPAAADHMGWHESVLAQIEAARTKNAHPGLYLPN